jgi:TolA-binding protein
MSLCDVRFVAISFCFLALPALAQRQPNPAGSNQPPAGSDQGINPGMSDPSLSGGSGRQPQIPLMQQQTRPIYLAGRVVLDDGTAPTDIVMIQTVCGGMSRTQAYTDSKGRFSFQFGDNNSGVFQDASVGNSGNPFGAPNATRGNGGGLSMPLERVMQQCDVEAKLPGYQSDSISLTARRASDNPEIGTIIMHRMGKVEGTVISVTSLAAPKPARKAYEKGQQAFKDKKLEDAAKRFQEAVQAYPEYAAAWLDLGRVQLTQNRVEEASKSLDAAIKADPKLIEPYLALAVIQAEAKKWPEVARTTDTVIRLNPYDYPQGYFLNAVAHYYLRDFDAAEKSAREGQNLDKLHRFPKSWAVLGEILAERHDYAGAAEQLRTYLSYAPHAPDAAAIRQQLDQFPH